MLAVDDAQPVAASVVEVGDARERFAQWREGKAGKVLSVSVIGDSNSDGRAPWDSAAFGWSIYLPCAPRTRAPCGPLPIRWGPTMTPLCPTA